MPSLFLGAITPTTTSSMEQSPQRATTPGCACFGSSARRFGSKAESGKGFGSVLSFRNLGLSLKSKILPGALLGLASG